MRNVAKWNLDQVNLESGFFMILGVAAGTCLCSVTVLVGVCLQGWFLHTGLPWKLLAAPHIFTGSPPIFDGTGSQAHQLTISLTLIN